MRVPGSKAEMGWVEDGEEDEEDKEDIVFIVEYFEINWKVGEEEWWCLVFVIGQYL